MLDEDNFIDYMCLMIYSGNFDWIGGNHRSWKEKKSGAKWRFMLDDLDLGFQANSKYADRVLYNNSFEMITSKSGVIMTDLFIALLKNSTFENKFRNRFNDLLNTLFSPTNVNSLVEKLADEKKEYMYLEDNKWVKGLIFFNSYLDDLKTFTQLRRDLVKTHLDNFLRVPVVQN